MSVSSIKSIHIWETNEWKALKEHVKDIEKLHLRDLLQVLQFYNYNLVN